MKKRVQDCFHRNQDFVRRRIVEITRELVRQRTVNAGKSRLAEFPYLKVPGQETLACNVVADVLKDWGIPSEIHEGAPLRGNILAQLFHGKPVLMMGLHLDVVPPGDGWETDPFDVVERDGQLIGRGVLDDLGPMASVLLGAWMLKESGVQLNGTLQIAGIASEEYREPGEEDPGVEFLLRKGLIRPDMAVIPDIGEEMKVIDVAEKGRCVFHIRTTGVQAHGSTPERGINAAHMMARVLCAIEDVKLVHEVHPMLKSPSMNLGVLRGGVAANVVPHECQADVDVRFVPGQSVEGIRSVLELAARKALEGRYGPQAMVQVTTASSVEPHAIPADHALVRSIQTCTKDVLGLVPTPIGIGGGTFAKTFNLGGIPAVGFGPGRDDQFHVVNETIELEQLVQFSLVSALLACDLLA
jgi:acetylornithine deacetylase/succinyl-diaminopimelate desuccinylase family protein